MGAGQSIPDSRDGHPPTRGLHVLRVTASSPASQTDLEPFFDFIIGYERESVSRWHTDIEAHDFEAVVEELEGKRLFLIVWSSKTKSVRQVPIVPSRAWSQTTAVVVDPQKHDAVSIPQPSLLGLSMRLCEPEFSLDNVWHVLDVLEGSPAESAGLVPYGDWIVGWSGGVLAAEGDFYDVVEAHEDKPLRVYVYSYDFDTLREVVLVPNRQWGGEGLLGCVFGYGLLHRIPNVPQTKPVQLAEEHDYMEEASMFVPADSEQYAGYDIKGTSNGHEYREIHPMDPPGEREGRNLHSVARTSHENEIEDKSSLADNNSTYAHYLDPPIAPVPRLPSQRPRPTPSSPSISSGPDATFYNARRLSGIVTPVGPGRLWSLGNIQNGANAGSVNGASSTPPNDANGSSNGLDGGGYASDARKEASDMDDNESRRSLTSVD